MKSNPIKTVLVITVGTIVLYLGTNCHWVLNISLIIGVLGLSSSYFAQKIDYLWMKLTWILSLIIPNIILVIVFYLLLTPIALLSKIFGEKNQFSLKNNTSSLFKDCNKQFDKTFFEKPW